MTGIRVEAVSEFRGETVVLVAMDAAGLEELAAAMIRAARHESAQLSCNGIQHHIIVRPGGADVDLGDAVVRWSLDRAKVVQIIEKLNALGAAGRPGHHYVDDFGSPAGTLVLSVDEYL